MYTLYTLWCYNCHFQELTINRPKQTRIVTDAFHQFISITILYLEFGKYMYMIVFNIRLYEIIFSQALEPLKGLI